MKSLIDGGDLFIVNTFWPYKRSRIFLSRPVYIVCFIDTRAVVATDTCPSTVLGHDSRDKGAHRSQRFENYSFLTTQQAWDVDSQKFVTVKDRVLTTALLDTRPPKGSKGLPSSSLNYPSIGYLIII